MSRLHYCFFITLALSTVFILLLCDIDFSGLISKKRIRLLDHLFYRKPVEINGTAELESVFQQRRDLVSHQCEKAFGPKFESPGRYFANRPHFEDFVMVNDDFKILFCSVPKVASTNWRRFFVRLKAGPDELINDELALHSVETMSPYLKPLNYKSSESMENLIARTKNYTKIMWVREPVRRLYSAWRSKFAVKNNFYWRNFGRYIRSKFAQKRNKIKGPIVSLEEFFRFLAHPTYRMDDVHWTLMYKLCMSCLIEYDYIGHLEDGQDVINYVIEKATGQSAILIDGDIEEASLSDSATASDLLNNIPIDLLQQVVSKYAEDYAMFGYPPPFAFDKK